MKVGVNNMENMKVCILVILSSFIIKEVTPVTVKLTLEIINNSHNLIPILIFDSIKIWSDKKQTYYIIRHTDKQREDGVKNNTWRFRRNKKAIEIFYTDY